MSRRKTDRSGEVVNSVRLNKRIDDYLPPGGSKGLPKYNCTCELCGRNYDSLYSVLTQKTLPGCGCVNLEQRRQPKPERVRDVSGQRFGRCVAKERTEDGKWICLCDCGNSFSTSLSHLTTGHTKSCGCFRVENSRAMKIKDFTGQRVGRLVAIKYMYSQKHPNGGSTAMWLCLCDCGSYTIVGAGELSSRRTRSCGCLGSSKRELEIRSWLARNNVSFCTEYKFEDLILKAHLRFDFAILDSSENLLGLVEHYGTQHYSDSSGIDFGKQQREITDKIKQDYCKEHGIKLYIIKYSDDIDKSLTAIMNELHVDTVPSQTA